MRWTAFVLMLLGLAGGRIGSAHACDDEPGTYDFLSSPRVSFAGSRYIVVWDHERGDGDHLESALETRALAPAHRDPGLSAVNIHTRLCARVVGSAGDRHLVVGTAERSVDNQPVSDILTLVLDQIGTATGPATTVTTLPYSQRPSGIAYNGNHFLVVGEGSREGATSITAMRLDSEGRALDRSMLIEHSLDGYVWLKPRVASAQGQFLVAWTTGRYSGGDQVGLYAIRISGDGEIIDEEPLYKPVSARVNAPAALASNGTEYFAVWADEEALYGARITTQGEIVTGQALANIAHPVFSLDIAWTGNEYVVTWTSSGKVHAIRVSGGHTPRASAPMVLADRGSESSTACGPTDCVMAWTDWQGGTSDIVGLHLERTSHGTMDMNASEIVIAEAAGSGCSIAGAGTAETGLPVALALFLVMLAGRRRG